MSLASAEAAISERRYDDAAELLDAIRCTAWDRRSTSAVELLTFSTNAVGTSGKGERAIGLEHLDAGDGVGLNSFRVAIQDHEVSQFAHFQAAHLVVEKVLVRGVEGDRAQRVIHRDPFVSPQGVRGNPWRQQRLPGDLSLHIPQRLHFGDRAVAMIGKMNTVSLQALGRMDLAGPLLAQVCPAQ